MSTTIDTKVAQLKFDNSQFEKGVNDSIKDVDKLNKALKFDQASDGLKEVSKTINSLNFNIVTDSLEIVTGKVSKFGEMVTGIFRKAGEDIEQFAVKTVKELSGLNNLAEGYNKYTTILEAENVLVSALSEKGKTLADVEGYVEDLAWYSDETSYNLTHMTDALSKFVNAGADVEQSVGAIQGIASWAAAAGVDANRASSAFYNLSQAMGSGYLGGMDEKSLELLNMMTPQFREIAISAGIAAGKVEDLGNGLYRATTGDGKEFAVESMKDSLKDKWLDADVLTTALGEYGKYSEGLLEFMKEYPDKYDSASEAMDDFDARLKELGKDEEYAISRNAFLMAQQSKTFKDVVEATKDAASTKWYNIIHSVVGDLDEAKKMWTKVCEEVYNIFVGPLDALSDAFKRWHKLGGRKLLIDALGNFYDNAKKIVGTIKEAFSNIFPMDTPLYAKLMNISGTLLKWSQRLKPTEKILNSIRTVVEFILKGVRLAIDAAKAVLVPAKDILGILIDIGKVLIYAIGQAIKHIVEIAKDLVKIIPIHWFKAIWDAIVRVISAIRTLVKTMMPQVKGFIGAFKSAFDAVTQGIRKSIKYSQPFAKVLSKVYLKLRQFVDVIKDITKRFQNGDLTGKLSQIGGQWGAAVGNFFNKVWPKVEGAIDWIFDQIPKIINILKKPLPYIKDFFGWLAELAGDAAEAIKTFVEETKPFEQIGEVFKAAGEKIAGFFENLDIGGKLKTAGERISEFFSSLKKGSEDDTPDVIDESNAKLENQVTLLDRLSDAWQSFKDAMAAAWGFIQEKAVAAGEWLDNATGGAFTTLIEGIKSLFEKLGSGEITIWDILLKIIEARIIFKSVIRLIELIKNPHTLLGSIKGIFTQTSDSIKKVGKSLAEFVEGFGDAINKKLLAGTFKAIARAILELAGALWIMSKIDTDTLKVMFPMVISFMIGLGKVAKDFLKGTSALADVTGGLSESKALKSISKTFTNIAKAVIILVAALWIVTKIDEEKAKTGMATIIMLMGALRQMVKQSQKGDVKDSGKQIKQIAKAMLVLVAAVYLFGSMDTDRLVQGMVAVIFLINAFKKFIKAYNESSKGSTRFDEVGKSFKQLAKAILILVGCIYLLGSMSLGKLFAGGVATIVLLAVLAAIYIFIQKSRINEQGNSAGMQGKTWKAIATGFVIIAAAMLIMANAILLMGILPTERIWSGAGALTMIMLAMAVIFGAISWMRGSTGNNKSFASIQPGTFNKIAAGFVILAAAMLIVANAILLFGWLPVENIWSAGGVLVMMLAAMAGIYALVAHTQKSVGKSFSAKTFAGIAAGMVVMSAALGACAAAIVAVGLLPLEQMIPAGIIMASIIALLAILMNLMSGKGGGGTILSGNNLVNIKGDFATKFLAIAAAVLVLAGAMMMLGKIGDNMKYALAGLGAIAIFMIVVSQISGQLSEAGTAMIKFFGGLAIGIVGVAAGVVLLAVAAAIFNSSLVALAAGLMLFAAGGDQMTKGAEVLGKSLKIIIKDVLDALAIAIIEFCRVVVEGFIEICAIVLRGIKNLFVILNDELPGILDELKETIFIVLAWIVEILPGLLDSLGTIINQILDWIITELPGWIGRLTVITSELAIGICEFIIAVLEAVAKYITENRDRIVHAIYAFIGAVLDLLWHVLTDWGNDPEVERHIHALFEMGEDIINGLVGGLEKAWASVSTFFMNAGLNLATYVSDLWDGITWFFNHEDPATIDDYFKDTRIKNMFSTSEVSLFGEVLDAVGDDFEEDWQRSTAIREYIQDNAKFYTDEQYGLLMNMYEQFLRFRNGAELMSREEFDARVAKTHYGISTHPDSYYEQFRPKNKWDKYYDQLYNPEETLDSMEYKALYNEIDSAIDSEIRQLINAVSDAWRTGSANPLGAGTKISDVDYSTNTMTVTNNEYGSITIQVDLEQLSDLDNLINLVNQQVAVKQTSIKQAKGKQEKLGKMESAMFN